MKTQIFKLILVFAVVGTLALLFGGGCGVDMAGLTAQGEGGRGGNAGGKGGSDVSGMGGQSSIGGTSGNGGQGGNATIEPISMDGGALPLDASVPMDATDYTVCPPKAVGCIWTSICGGVTCCLNPDDVEAYKCHPAD